VIADVQPNGRLQTADALRVAQHVGGAAVPDIVPLPAGLPPLVFAGADPKVEIATVNAAAGSLVDVPVTIDTAAGLQSFVLVVRYDPAALSFDSVVRSGLSADFEHLVVRQAAGEVTIDATRLQALEGGSGELLQLRFAVAATAPAGAQAIDLASVRLNDTWLTVLPLPQPGPDATDGAVIVAPPAATGASQRRAGTPKLVFDTEQGGGDGFALAQRGDTSWLNRIVSDRAATAAAQDAERDANRWTISVRR
jgi:hypothetical protein